MRITEADTTSATRIFYKCLFQELAENMGLQALVKHMGEPSVREFLAGVFPKDSMANMRFSINFFTAVGLGGLTTDLREDLKRAQAEMKEAEVQRQLAALAAGTVSLVSAFRNTAFAGCVVLWNATRVSIRRTLCSRASTVYVLLPCKGV